MRILIADDERIPRRVLESRLREWGYDVQIACDGREAWEALRYPKAPRLAVLDWMMPGFDGPEVCRKVREMGGTQPPYLILLTARESKEDIVAGLKSGANDYVTKPFDDAELQARVHVGRNVVDLQESLAERVRELEKALIQVNQLHGLLPICCYCKSIRDDNNYWQKVEAYIASHCEVRFSHGICPDCWTKTVEPELAKLKLHPEIDDELTNLIATP